MLKSSAFITLSEKDLKSKADKHIQQLESIATKALDEKVHSIEQLQVYICELHTLQQALEDLTQGSTELFEDKLKKAQDLVELVQNKQSLMLEEAMAERRQRPEILLMFDIQQEPKSDRDPGVGKLRKRAPSLSIVV